MEVKHSPSL